MAKMTKATAASLERILSDLERGLRYLDRDDVRVARTLKPEHALGYHFTRAPMSAEYREHAAPREDRAAPDYALATVAKDIGSDLAGLRQARRSLRHLLGLEC